MKELLCILAFAVLITLGLYYPIVWWIIGIVIIGVIVLVYFLSSSFDKHHDGFMKSKFGENYKQLIAEGKLELCTAYPCKPDPYYTSVVDIRKKSGINLPTFFVSECKETLADFTGDYSGEATIEFATAIDGDIMEQIKCDMQKDGSLWRKADVNVYVCDLLKPYVGTSVTDEYWNISIKENSSIGVIKYGKV